MNYQKYYTKDCKSKMQFVLVKNGCVKNTVQMFIDYSTILQKSIFCEKLVNLL